MIPPRRERRRRVPHSPDSPPMGISQEGGVSGIRSYVSKLSRISRLWQDKLRRRNWRLFRPRNQDWGFVPASLDGIPMNVIRSRGKEGIHFALGWSGLAEMIDAFGENHSPTLHTTGSGTSPPFRNNSLPPSPSRENTKRGHRITVFRTPPGKKNHARLYDITDLTHDDSSDDEEEEEADDGDEKEEESLSMTAEKPEENGEHAIPITPRNIVMPTEKSDEEDGELEDCAIPIVTPTRDFDAQEEREENDSPQGKEHMDSRVKMVEDLWWEFLIEQKDAPRNYPDRIEMVERVVFGTEQTGTWEKRIQSLEPALWDHRLDALELMWGKHRTKRSIATAVKRSFRERMEELEVHVYGAARSGPLAPRCDALESAQWDRYIERAVEAWRCGDDVANGENRHGRIRIVEERVFGEQRGSLSSSLEQLIPM